MPKKLINKKILDIYDKYDGDFGLLTEPWANFRDRRIITHKIAYILSEYIDLHYMINSNNISEPYKKVLLKESLELEKYISDEVIQILNKRGYYR